MADISTILWLSVAVQCIAVVLALRLIPLTGRAFAWMVLSAAFLLMAARRVISLLYQQGGLDDNWLMVFSTELVALIISILIAIGVLMIRKIFVQWQSDEAKIRMLSLAVEQNPGPIIITDIDGKIVYINAAYCNMAGKDFETVRGKLTDIFDPGVMGKKTLKNIKKRLKAGNVWQGEIRNKFYNNALRWQNTSISPVKTPLGKVSHYVILQEDITQKRKQLDQLEHMALHDALTDLPNRTLFNDRLKQAILSARRKKEPLAVMLLDLNNFKEINDSMGHGAGDQILKEIAKRLQGIMRGGDTVARMGGDEFLILLPMANPQKQSHFINRVNTILEAPFILQQQSFEIRVSVGVALFPDDGEEPEELLKRADVAMYAAKKSAETHKRYDKNLDEDSFNRLELSHSLRTAVAEDQLILHYQPIVNFLTGDVDQVEALVRWNHPIRGIIYPDHFIPLAEQTHNIGVITRWVIKHAVQQLSDWHKRGLKIGVSINISAHDLIDLSLADYISTELDATQLEPSFLTIEMTESALMQRTAETLDNLAKLRKTGIQINIDDFGTGYSSLQYLTKFPVTGLKIDKSFVMNMVNDENAIIIVRSTIDLAHNIGLKVVAEGIEDSLSYQSLKKLGCDYGQGYLLSKPIGAEALFLWHSDWENHKSRTLI
ncbi:MAG: EAL domain-containing protein [Cycloclasticus sp.]|nr:EAL domain-containing protein [Cycloclasticus sp.]